MTDFLQPMDIAGSYGRGRSVFEMNKEAERQNAMQGFLAQNAGALMSGDQNALAGYAQYAPEAAFGMQQGRERTALATKQAEHGMANDDARLAIAREQGRMQAAEFALQMDDRQREEVAAKAKQASETALIAYKQGPEAWDRWNDSNQDFENVAYEDAPIKISTALGAVEALMPQGPAEPLSPEGKLEHDVRNNLVDPNAPKPYDFKAEEDLRKEYTGLGPVKSFQVQSESVGKVIAAADDPSAAGDLALIFSFMKILDPNSVVREQEFANAQNAAGVPDMVRNAWNRAKNGERLNPDQRADFIKTAIATYKQAEGQMKSITDQYGTIADERELSRKRALPNFGYAGDFPELPPLGGGADTPEGPTQIQTVDEYNALPPGTQYIDPNGKPRVKR